MKKTGYAFILVSGLLLSAVLIACPPPEDTPDTSVELSQIDFYFTNAGGPLSGNLIIQIRDEQGNVPAIKEITIAASTLLDDPENWYPLAVSDCTLNKGTVYRLYVIRNVPDPGSGTDRINWGGNQISGTDYYPPGQNDWAITAPALVHDDYGFRTYNDGVMDQTMENIDYGFSSIGNSDWKWQEFVPCAEY